MSNLQNPSNPHHYRAETESKAVQTAEQPLVVFQSPFEYHIFYIYKLRNLKKAGFQSNSSKKL